MRKISRVVTAIFLSMFSINCTAIVIVYKDYLFAFKIILFLGAFIIWSIIPAIFWIITYIVEKEKPL